MTRQLNANGNDFSVLLMILVFWLIIIMDMNVINVYDLNDDGQ